MENQPETWINAADGMPVRVAPDDSGVVKEREKEEV